MPKIYYDKDASTSPLKGKTIGVVGYGSQGHAHAQNLRDSGYKVLVGLYKGSKSWQRAEKNGLKVVEVDELVAKSDLLAMLAPDVAQRQIYAESMAKEMKKGKTLLFSHGFNIHYGQIVPPADIDVVMIAPKCPGHMLRQLYNEGSGPPALIAVHQNASGKAQQIALSYARGIGCTRAGVLETTFAEETETDLFGEQAVLCGGASALIKAGFDTLVKAGYQPEVAYFECLHELKLIVDLIYNGGLAYMRHSVSDTAEYGDYSRGPRVIDSKVREEMQRILEEIQTGAFAREWILENQTGRPGFNISRSRESGLKIEEVGKKLRAMMPWLTGPKE